MILEDFKNSNGLWVRYITSGRKLNYTRSGATWQNMQGRCKVDGYLQKKEPAYIGCTVGFLDFQHFAEWSVVQIGYNKGFHLDKDILSKNNKIYSPDSCVYVPASLNKFFNTRKNHRGACPIGTYWDTKRQLFVAQSSFDGKYHYLGGYEQSFDAFLAYKQFKEEVAKQLAHKWEGVVDPRVIVSLLDYKVDIGD